MQSLAEEAQTHPFQSVSWGQLQKHMKYFCLEGAVKHRRLYPKKSIQTLLMNNASAAINTQISILSASLTPSATVVTCMATAFRNCNSVRFKTFTSFGNYVYHISNRYRFCFILALLGTYLPLPWQCCAAFSLTEGQAESVADWSRYNDTVHRRAVQAERPPGADPGPGESIGPQSCAASVSIRPVINVRRR